MDLHWIYSQKKHKCHITDCHAGNPCVHKLDPTNYNEDPIIRRNEWQRSMGAVVMESSRTKKLHQGTIKLNGRGASLGRAPKTVPGLSSDTQEQLVNIGEARTWLDKEPPRSILTWDDLVSKFINQFFPPSKTTYLRNEITTFYQKPNETFNEAWERFKGLLRQCPHHGFSELHQLDTFYNSLNTNDQDALDSAAGGNFLDKMPRDGLAIIESKSKVRYSRSRAIEPRVSTNAPLSTSTPSNSFEFQQLAASLEDKMDIRMSRLEKMISEKNVTSSLRSSVEELCVTCGSNHNFNNYPLTRNEFPAFHDNIHQFQQTAALDNFVQFPEKLKDPGKFLIMCALQELDRTSALANSGASINLLPHSIYKKLGLEALTPTRMTLELANRSITHPMGIEENVVVRVNGFTFLADFLVVNFEPDPRVPIILGRPFLRTAKALIDLYEETLTLRVGKEELVYYADKSEKNKNKHCVHAISVIDFSKDDPFSGSTTTHSDDPSPSSSPVKTSDNFEKIADELALLDSLPPGNDDSTLKKVLHEENFQVNLNPLFDEIEENVEIKNSNVSDEPVLLHTPLSDKVECFAPEDNNDEIDDFLAMEVSSNFEEGYFDSEGDVTFLDNLLSDDASHNLASEVISDHEPEQNESSITFSPRSDPLHHEFAGEPLTLPARNDHEFEEYLSLMTVLCEISTSQSQGNVHANQSSVIESLPVSPIPVEDSEPTQEEIDIFLVPDDLIPPGVENDDSEDEVNESPNLDHQDDPSIPRPPPEPPDIEKCFKPEAGILITKEFKGVSKPHDFMADILPTLPTLVLDFTFILFLSFGSEDTIFDPGIST
ncbi:reverse transcriptase domain-containing protein [Tanacetum coccineum]|uniref:Reverse transcriptase domain-containing protein n=1 Tax=Tanacetum coccineum TaxID=301880 RepID=A0ABQ5IH29_9ASTR